MLEKVPPRPFPGQCISSFMGTVIHFKSGLLVHLYSGPSYVWWPVARNRRFRSPAAPSGVSQWDQMLQIPKCDPLGDWRFAITTTV